MEHYEIVEPKVPEIIQSAWLYLAIKNLMKEEKAQAIASSHCMGTPRGCLSFSKLNDLGLVGACEGDIDSTLTMLLFAYPVPRPIPIEQGTCLGIVGCATAA